MLSSQWQDGKNWQGLHATKPVSNAAQRLAMNQVAPETNMNDVCILT
jgi:hypothetical protein